MQLIENRKNMGFAQTNNQAIHQSRGRYLLLLNPETVVLPGVLTKLVSFLDQHPEAGAAGGCVFNPDGSLQISCYPAPTLLNKLARFCTWICLFPMVPITCWVGTGIEPGQWTFC